MGGVFSDSKKEVAAKKKIKQERKNLKSDKQELDKNFAARQKERRTSRQSMEEQWNKNRTGRSDPAGGKGAGEAKPWGGSWFSKKEKPVPAARRNSVSGCFLFSCSSVRSSHLCIARVPLSSFPNSHRLLISSSSLPSLFPH